MKTRRRIVLLLACGALVAGVFSLVSRPREPSYNGRRIREWLELYTSDAVTSRSSDEAPDAIRGIGTNAIPYLLKWIRYEPPRWREILGYGDIPDWLREWIVNDTKDDLATAACNGFQLLGPDAESAIPELARIMNAPHGHVSSARAMSALHDFGCKAFLPIVFALTNQPWSVLKYGFQDNQWITNCTSSLGTNAQPALPALIQCLNHGDEWASGRAAMVLSHLKLAPGLVVESVAASLQHSNAHVRLLTAAVLESQQAEPPLDPEVRTWLMLLDDPSPTVRTNATNILRALDHRALSNVIRAASALVR